MDAARARALVARYAALSGDAAQRRLPGFIAAYCAVRCAAMAFALQTAATAEMERLASAADAYRGRLRQLLRERALLE